MNQALPNLTPVPREPVGFDFDAPPAERWKSSLGDASTATEIREFVKAAHQVSASQFGWLGESALALVAGGLYCGAYRHFGRYVDESDALADHLNVPGISRHVMAFLQRVYSLAHLGCTAAAVPVGGLGDGTRLMRSMDWVKPAKELGRVTRVIEHRQGGNVIYRSVGALGMCGHLSAVKAGVGAVTINWAATTEGAQFFMDPTLRLREVMESRDTRSFKTLVNALKSKPLAAPVFFTVCGPQRGEAVVLEYSGPKCQEWCERWAQDGDDVIVQSNHFVANHRLAVDDPDPGLSWVDAAGKELEESTWARKSRMEELIHALGPMDRLDPQKLFARVLSEAPIRNVFSRQQMVLNPVDGSVTAWAHRS